MEIGGGGLAAVPGSETVSIASSGRRVSYDVLRIVSICAVVGIHTFGQIPEQAANIGTTKGWIAAFLSSAFVWAVPVFVMLSGALNLEPRALRGSVSEFYRRRGKRIIPALCFWTLIYLVLLRIVLDHESFSPIALLTTLTDPTVAPQLYFLWVILGLYLLTPMIGGFLERGGPRRATLMGVVVLGVTFLDFALVDLLGRQGIARSLETNIFTAWLPYVGFYIAGYSLTKLRIPGWLGFLSLVAVFGCETVIVASKMLQIPGGGWHAVYFVAYWASPIAVYLAGSLMDRIRLRSRMRWVIEQLAEASFGVFLVHVLLLEGARALLPGLRAGMSLPQAALAYVLVLVTSFAVSLVEQRIPYLRLVF